MRGPHLRPAPPQHPTVAVGVPWTDKTLRPQETTTGPMGLDGPHDDDAGGGPAVRTLVARGGNQLEARATTRVPVNRAKATEVAVAEGADSNAVRGIHLRAVSTRTFLHPRISEASTFHRCLPLRCHLPTRLRQMFSGLHLQRGVLAAAVATTTMDLETDYASAQPLAKTTHDDETPEGKDVDEVQARLGGTVEVTGAAEAAEKVAPVASSSSVRSSSGSNRGEIVERWSGGCPARG